MEIRVNPCKSVKSVFQSTLVYVYFGLAQNRFTAKPCNEKNFYHQ